mmetsp:Transcript_9297/g.34399  ORF Transcript_9297/g.34399 Transcript_9297/m.34399 type:complete len:85 (-) Transcript_9297:379-633(-)
MLASFDNIHRDVDSHSSIPPESLGFQFENPTDLHCTNCFTDTTHSESNSSKGKHIPDPFLFNTPSPSARKSCTPPTHSIQQAKW